MISLNDFNNIIFHNNKNNSHVEEDKETKAMISLWRAVITQALQDAGSDSRKFYSIIERRKSRQWLKGKSRSFFEICALADMNPEYVINQAQLAIRRNCKWRNDLKDGVLLNKLQKV